MAQAEVIVIHKNKHFLLNKLFILGNNFYLNWKNSFFRQKIQNNPLFFVKFCIFKQSTVRIFFSTQKITVLIKKYFNIMHIYQLNLKK